MNDEALLRYSRQIMLPEIDVAGQERLLQARVIIIGLGGLGSAASVYLAAAGVGHLVLIDYDRVELANLQRQVVHSSGDIGRAKVDSARDHLLSLNPEVEIDTIGNRLDNDALEKVIAHTDAVVDGSDNFPTRFAINQACVKTRTPLVSGAAISYEGQISVFCANKNSPCYRCLYNDEEAPAETCAATGVISPLLGIIGSLQAIETMKLIIGVGKTLQGRLLRVNALTMEWRTSTLNRDPDCPVCSPYQRDQEPSQTSAPARQADA